MTPTTDEECRQQQTILNLEKELSTRFETYKEDRRVLMLIKDIIDNPESMKKVKDIINDWYKPDNVDGIDYVHINIDAANHTNVLITYPAYTNGNKNAMEYAIAAIVSKLRKGDSR